MPAVLDLFCGAGGLSLGAHGAGFQTAAAFDADSILSSGYVRNFGKETFHLGDVRELDKTSVRQLVSTPIDGVIGGPPCQAFSEMGHRDIRDKRRTLVLDYFRIVAAVRPKFFLFENVRGLGFDEHKQLLQDGIGLLPKRWKILGPVILNAADFGAPTRRKRLFVFGFNPDEMEVPSLETMIASTPESVDVRDAIHDLASARFIGRDDEGFDHWRYDGRRIVSAYASRMRTKSGMTSGHWKTEHVPDTIKRFARVEPGKSDKIGKYVRLTWAGVCPTLRAGTGSDRGSYQAVRPLHPDEDRVITPREAARLQGFPDTFQFHPTVWHSCRMIGNSVSPILAEVLLTRIRNALEGSAVAKIAAE